MTSSPTTLVTGAAGYVGRAVVAALESAGHRLVLVDRTFVESPMASHHGHDAIVGDARNLLALLEERDQHRDIDHVIHAATVTASPERHPEAVVTYLEDHLAASLAALRLAARHGASAVLISSAAVFAPDQRDALDEEAAPSGTRPYATAKRAAERIWAEAADAGLRAMTVRLGNLYGGDERASQTRPRISLLQRYLDAALRERRIVVAQPDALRDWTYLPDAVTRLVNMLSGPHELPRLMHLVAPLPCSDLILARTIARAVPGTRVELEPSSERSPRGPLISRHALSPRDWTSLEDGIAARIEALNEALA